ncbi:MAG: 3-dehydroquinate synthase II [Candidatus Helarchaeota archaeon]|nr:3-dehydroquinate synthase II [Candidatus Helarchaeota archaeon]
MKQIVLHLDGDWNAVRETAINAMTSGINNFLIEKDISDKLRELGNVVIYSFSEDLKPDVVIDKSIDKQKIEEYSKKSESIGHWITVKVKKDEEVAINAADLGSNVVIISATDWKIIPMENIIADLHKKDTQLYAEVKNVEEARVMFETLEIGVDGVVFQPKTDEEISQIKKLLREEIELKLTPAKIVKIKEVGSGDRVCIDTCSLLSVGEGMLIGSQSMGLFLIHSESIPSEFADPRPFRVNAGAVHAYILLPNGKTQYLSEIEAGSEVLIVSNKGEGRTATVGRSKIEKRPLLLIEAQIKDTILKTLVQNAETIRLVKRENNEDIPTSVSELKEGDDILVYYVPKGGRHFGKPVDETILEK